MWGGGPPGVSCVSLHLPQVTELRAFQAHPVWMLPIATHSVRTHRLSYAPSGTRAFQVHLCGLLPVATHSVRTYRLSYASSSTRAFQVHLCGCPLSLLTHRLSYAPPGTRAFQVHLCGLLPVAFSDLGQRGADPTAVILNTLLSVYRHLALHFSHRPPVLTRL